METVRFILAAIFLAAGVISTCIAVFGVFKFKYVLNRMHAAAIIDTFGLLFSLIGVSIMNGFNLALLKIVIILVFLWLANPVGSHLIARLVVATDGDFKKECEIKDTLSSDNASPDKES